MRLLAATLLCLFATGEPERAVGEAFVGSWISSATDDRIAAAVIVRQAGVLQLDLTDACGSTADCALPRMPIVMFGPEGRPASQRGLAVLSRGQLLTHVTFRMRDNVLHIDTYEFGLGRLFRRHRRSRLVRYAPVPTPAPGSVTPRFPSALFQQYFGEAVSTPAYYVDPSELCGEGPNATATAYLRVSETTSNLMTLRLSANQAVSGRTRRTVLTPAGTIRVLVVLIAYPETFGPADEIAWQRAQAAVNADHAAFAASRSYRGPLVVFRNTNLVVPRFEVRSPQLPAQVRLAAEARGVRADDFDVLMTIDLDPARPDGGLAVLASRTVYVGNFMRWRSTLDDAQWRSVAATAYHHEVAHLWGWEHGWSPRCEQREGLFAPFVTSPALLGWDDLDGDRIPEILDPTPYGRVK